VDAYRCKVNVECFITRCGFDSISYGPVLVLASTHFDLTPEQCKTSYYSGKLQIDEDKEIDIEKERPGTYSYWSKGKRTVAAECVDKQDFWRADMWHENSVEQTIVSYHFSKLTGLVYHSKDQVMFEIPGVGKLYSTYTVGFLYDHYAGAIAWTHTPMACNYHLVDIYHGDAELHELKNSTDFVGSLVTVESEKTSQYAGLVLKSLSETCGQLCYETQVKDLIACQWKKESELLANQSYRATDFNIDRLEQIVLLSYQMIRGNLDAHERMSKMLHLICENERTLLRTKLKVLAGGNVYAMIDFLGPGHSVLVVSMVAYVTCCKSIRVELAHYNNCTIQIPVKRKIPKSLNLPIP